MFLNWMSNDWSQKGITSTISSLTTCPHKLKGLHAYACRQAHVFCDIHDHFFGIWKGLELPQERLTEPTYPVDLGLDVVELDRDDA